jgi:hypothetical protein
LKDKADADDLCTEKPEMKCGSYCYQICNEALYRKKWAENGKLKRINGGGTLPKLMNYFSLNIDYWKVKNQSTWCTGLAEAQVARVRIADLARVARVATCKV